jgi:CheY-like chemotaxis protein
MAVRVLVVDQNDDFLDALTGWLDAQPGLEVVGRAHDGRQAIERVEREVPDVVVLDVMLPDMTGIEATRRIKSRPGAPQVVLMSFHDSRAARAEAAAAGADDCIPKAEVTHALLPAIEQLVRLHDAGDRESTAVPDREGPSIAAVEKAVSRIEPKERRKV